MPSLQESMTWFETITGLPEYEWLSRRDESILEAPNGDLQIQNVYTGQRFEAGNFSVHSLQDIAEPINSDINTLPQFEVHVRTSHAGLPSVDVANLQAQAKSGTLFQVASNFNCVEVAHPSVHPDGGRFVTNLAVDSTQGPAASASGGVSAITRVHAPFYDPNINSNDWGQTIHRQVELLGHPLVAPHFPVTNGKLIFHGTEPTDYNPDALFKHIRMGLHRRVRPYFGLRRPPFMEYFENPPSIDQVFVAALNYRAPKPYAHHLESKAKMLLKAAYHGTYHAAIQCENSQMVLTLIGGGSFANPPAYIASAIAEAHASIGHKTTLNRVILPLFSIDGIVQGTDFVALLKQAFAEHEIAYSLDVKYI